MAKLDRWGSIRARKLSQPGGPERYERARRSVAQTRRVVQEIDAERQRAGLTKAELAKRIGTSPSIVRRLLTSGTGNPTLRTVLDVLDALDLDLVIRSKPRSKESRDPSGSDRSAANAAPG